MATDIVADGTVDTETSAPEPGLQPKYTPEDHQKAAPALKVIRLVELGSNRHGKAATFEFTGGFVRSIDLDAQTVWHASLQGLDAGDLRKLLEHVAPRHKEADGTVRVQDGPMWFWTRRETPRGRWLGRSYFDVPAEDYGAGRLTGAKAARDLILFLKEHRPSGGLPHFIRHGVHECLEEAFALGQTPWDGKEPRRGAAVAFCQIVTQFFCLGATYANPAYLDQQVEQEEASMSGWAEFEERQRLETADRMRAARAAKAAKRAAAHALASSAALQFTTNEGVATGHTLQ